MDALFFVAEDAVFDRINRWETGLVRRFHSQQPRSTAVRYEGIDQRLVSSEWRRSKKGSLAPVVSPLQSYTPRIGFNWPIGYLSVSDPRTGFTQRPQSQSMPSTFQYPGPQAIDYSLPSTSSGIQPTGQSYQSSYDRIAQMAQRSQSQRLQSTAYSKGSKVSLRL